MLVRGVWRGEDLEGGDALSRVGCLQFCPRSDLGVGGLYRTASWPYLPCISKDYIV